MEEILENHKLNRLARFCCLWRKSNIFIFHIFYNLSFYLVSW